MIASERALILAPTGRDGALALSLLQDGGKTGEICRDLPEMLRGLAEGAGLAIVTDEALQFNDLGALRTWIAGQPPWSDFPFVVLTRRVPGAGDNPYLRQLEGLLGSVIFLERPFRAAALVSIVDNALRGRRRQYQARGHLEDLREAEKRLTTALHAGQMGSWDLDVATWDLRASDQFKANFGRDTAEAFSYDDLLSSIAAEDLGRMRQCVFESIATGADYVIEYRAIWPDGSRHWIDARARVLRDATGRALRMVGVTSDITQRKTAEAQRERLLVALDAERERTQEALSGERALSGLLSTGVPAGIVAYDTHLRVTIWNPVMERLFGVASADAHGRQLADLIGDGSRDAIERRLFAVLDDRAEPVEEMEFHAASGATVILQSQYSPLRGGDGRPIGGAGFFLDVTERRRAEEQLRQSQKMETIGQLTGGVAHDFNNLLAAIQGSLELLRKRMPDDATAHRYIDAALQGARRGASLTSRLLAFARRQDLNPVATDMAQLLEGMRSLVDRSIGPLVVVVYDMAGGLPPARVDPNQLELAVLNLAVNARDAMPDGGTLTIGLDKRAADGALGLDGDFLIVSVADTGTGMDAETLASAIEPFFSTKELGKGTGLGLSMVYGLAEQLGGALHLRSTLGAGTTAELWLPISQAKAAPAPPAQAVEATLPALRILVVDDDALVAMGTIDMLEDLGHAVIEAYSGQQALDVLARGEAVDVMVTDFAMPGMTGVELARQARELHPGLPILLATGYADLPSGSSDLPRLPKPFQQSEIAGRLADLFARKPA